MRGRCSGGDVGDANGGQRRGGGRSKGLGARTRGEEVRKDGENGKVRKKLGAYAILGF